MSRSSNRASYTVADAGSLRRAIAFIVNDGETQSMRNPRALNPAAMLPVPLPTSRTVSTPAGIVSRSFSKYLSWASLMLSKVG